MCYWSLKEERDEGKTDEEVPGHFQGDEVRMGDKIRKVCFEQEGE